MEATSAALEKWNLRDQTFKVLLDFRSAGNKPTGVFDPDAQVFPSQPMQPADRVTATSEDGFLWFARVSEDVGGGPRVFHHLIGNVAELVFEDPAFCDAKEKAQLGEMVQSPASDKHRVIGGSAMSKVADPVNVPMPVPLVESDKSAVSTRGFSDVGMRPAFTARTKKTDVREVPYAVKVAEFLKLAPYLPPAGG